MFDPELKASLALLAAQLGESPFAAALDDEESVESPEAVAAELDDAAWRRGLLRELAEAGMEMVRDLRDQSVANRETATRTTTKAAARTKAATAAVEETSVRPTPLSETGDPTTRFVKLSRAIRLTVALHAMTAADIGKLRERQAMAARAATARAEKASAVEAEAAKTAAENIERERHLAARADVECLMELALDTEIADRDQARDFQFAFEERLELDPFYNDLHLRPLAEIVETLCRDIALPPNPRRVIDAVPPEDPSLGTRPLSSPFNRPSPRLIYPKGIMAGLAANPNPG